MIEEMKFQIDPCPRCGGRHVQTRQRLENNPPVLRSDAGRYHTVTHWTLCPSTDEPVLMSEHGALDEDVKFSQIVVRGPTVYTDYTDYFTHFFALDQQGQLWFGVLKPNEYASDITWTMANHPSNA